MKRISEITLECERSGYIDEANMLNQILAKMAIKTAQGSGYWSKSNDTQESDKVPAENTEPSSGDINDEWDLSRRWGGREFYNAVKGKTFAFYGAHSNKFKLNETVWAAIEDEDDGYRSMLDTVAEVTQGKGILDGFFTRPIAKVEVVFGPYNSGGANYYHSIDEGFILKDVDTKHVWLVVGTNNLDDYYPLFVFNYVPDKSQNILFGQWSKT